MVGYTNNDLPPRQRAIALHEILGHAAAGAVAFDYAIAPLDDAADAWTRQASGDTDRRIVLAVAEHVHAPHHPGA